MVIRLMHEAIDIVNDVLYKCTFKPVSNNLEALLIAVSVTLKTCC